MLSEDGSGEEVEGGSAGRRGAGTRTVLPIWIWAGDVDWTNCQPSIVARNGGICTGHLICRWQPDDQETEYEHTTNRGTVASGRWAHNSHHVSRPCPCRVSADPTETRGEDKEDTKRRSGHPQFWSPHDCPRLPGLVSRGSSRPLKYLK